MKPRISRTRMLMEFWRGIRFLSVGGLGLATDTVLFMALHGIGADRAVARAVSLGVATCVTWALNRGLTFTRTGRGAAGEFSRYGLVAMIVQGFNYISFLWLSAVFAQVYPPLLILFCGATAAGFSYLGQRLFTFAPETPADHENAR